MLVAICAVGMLAATTDSALATAAPNNLRKPVTPGSTWLALGDSVTFGYQESTVFPAPNYHNASSFFGYPELLGSELQLNVVNAACPGETTASMIDTMAQSNGCENTPGAGSVGYRTMFPLHVGYSGPQLDFAKRYLRHNTVRLVSLMIGANDFFVCQETTPDHCASSAEVAGVVASVTHNVKRILTTIRKTAHYRGQLAIVNYYSLDYADPVETAGTQLLNQTVDAAASGFHVVIADGFGELQTAALHSGSNTCTAGLLTQLVGVPNTPCGVHPSYAGQSLLAQALEKVIRLG
jgi:lysophospholipase L1-like esterase